MVTIAMLIADLERMGRAVDDVAADLRAHTELIDGLSIPDGAFGAGESARQRYQQGRTELVSRLADTHPRAGASAELIRTAMDHHQATDADLAGRIRTNGAS